MATAKKTSAKPEETTAASGQPGFGTIPSLDDLRQLAERFKVPGIDVSAIVESQRKDLEALAEANRQAYEGMKALAERRNEMLRESLQRFQAGMQSAGSGGNAVSQGSEQVQRELQQAIENFRELAEMEAESRSKAWKVLQDRFEENVANLRNLLTPQKKEG